MSTMTNDQDRPFKVPSGWVVGAVFAILAVLAVLLVADRLYHPDNFQIENIVIKGVRLSNVDVDRVGDTVRTHLNGNFFTVKLPEIKNRIREVPWVFSSTIQRKWPETLIVHLEEVQPVARWGEKMLLNVTGDPVTVPNRTDKQEYANLPRLSGPKGEEKHVWSTFRKWSVRFESVGLTLVALTLDANRLWHLELSLSQLSMSRSEQPEQAPAAMESPVVMTVREQNSTMHILRFVKALDQRLVAYFSSMQHVDLRYPNGFAVLWKEGQPESMFRELDTTTTAELPSGGNGIN